MRRIVLLLVCWLALSRASPYGKVANYPSQTQEQDNYSQSSAYASASAQAGYDQQNESVGKTNPWWMTAPSPFKSPDKGCVGCTASETVSSPTYSSSQDLGHNPFFQGGSSTGADQSHHTGHQDQSNNPFFTGQNSQSGSAATASASASANANANPAQQPTYNSKPGQSYEESQVGEGQQNVFLGSSGFQQHNFDSGLSVSCSGSGKICVERHLCVNGRVSNGVQGLTQVRNDDQQCDIDREVCCTLSYQGQSGFDQSASGNYDQVQTTANGANSNGGIFGSYNQQELDSGDGQQGIEEANGYLPPIGSEPSSNVPAFSIPPQKPQQPSGERPDQLPAGSGPAPTHVQLGCAAALICVEDHFCGMDGMINSEPLSLSSSQLLRRVPLSDCKNPDNGVIGKCCRDPNYVDPWPTGNLPANYSGGFDEQGFPTFLNIQKTRPTKRPSYQPSKNAIPPVKTVANNPSPIAKQGFPNFPSQISGIPSQINNFINGINNPFRPSSTGAPVVAGAQDDSPASDAPQPTTKKPFFSFPSFPNPFDRAHDESPRPTNNDPVVIAPHAPGNQCGVKNSVPRPSGLSDIDVAFGEIPWQAMILSLAEKKLLCSGAFVAPNAVLTAAHCVEGYKASEVGAKAGEWKLGYELKHEEPLPFEIANVAQILVHPGHQPGSRTHDLAILFLEHPVKQDFHVGTICLPQAPQPFSKCISTGWGKHIIEAHLAGAVMHSIDVEVIGEQECRQRLEDAEAPVEVDETLVCTKVQHRQNNMCQADLGGPLACDRGDGIYEIVGVYNQETGCLPTNQVATFALVDSEWVSRALESPPQRTAGPIHEPYRPEAAYHPGAYTPIASVTQKPYHADAYAPSTQKTYQPGVYAQSTEQPHQPEVYQQTEKSYTPEVYAQSTQKPYQPGVYAQSTQKPYQTGVYVQSTQKPYQPNVYQQTEKSYTPEVYAQSTEKPYQPGVYVQSTQKPYQTGVYAQSTQKPYQPDVYQQTEKSYTPEVYAQSTEKPYHPGVYVKSTEKPYQPGNYGQATEKPYQSGIYSQETEKPYNPAIYSPQPTEKTYKPEVYDQQQTEKPYNTDIYSQSTQKPYQPYAPESYPGADQVPFAPEQAPAQGPYTSGPYAAPAQGNQVCDCRQSNLPPHIHQYLPPV